MNVSNRLIYLSIFISCAALMGYGLYLQHAQDLIPCPMCILQRIAFVFIGVIALIAAIHHPKRTGNMIYSALIAIGALTGAGIAARHIYVQNLPPEQMAQCGPGLDYMIESFGLAQALPLIFKGEGECAASAWKFLGLTIPAWSLVWFAIFVIAAGWILLRAFKMKTRRFG
jgi:protein dithiol:quinone oxidoreductase